MTSRASQPRPGYRIPYSVQTRSETDVRRKRRSSNTAEVKACRSRKSLQGQKKPAGTEKACRGRKSLQGQKKPAGAEMPAGAE